MPAVKFNENWLNDLKDWVIEFDLDLKVNEIEEEEEKYLEKIYGTSHRLPILSGQCTFYCILEFQ